ncbi:MAG: PEP-CTERM sorting domain-containing protein [Verrucomicrobiales bacterium]|nr:PEP-CTERM sorting domain-containing protein [Verrucomicrobiales bacterium]
MINEYANTNGSVPSGGWIADGEFIEMVLTTNATVSELANLTFGDSNSSTSAIHSIFQFDTATLDAVLTASGQTSFLAGTIFVVKSATLGAQNLTYDPTLANIGNADAWCIELIPGLGVVDSPASPTGAIDVENTGEIIWVADGTPTSSTDTSGWLSAIGHDNNPGALATAVIDQFGANSFYTGAAGAPKALVNTADGIMALSLENDSTMGVPNTDLNAEWLVSVRGGALASVPEPNRMLLVGMGMAAWILQRRRVATEEAA